MRNFLACSRERTRRKTKPFSGLEQARVGRAGCPQPADVEACDCRFSECGTEDEKHPHLVCRQDVRVNSITKLLRRGALRTASPYHGELCIGITRRVGFIAVTGGVSRGFPLCEILRSAPEPLFFSHCRPHSSRFRALDECLIPIDKWHSCLR